MPKDYGKTVEVSLAGTGNWSRAILRGYIPKLRTYLAETGSGYGNWQLYSEGYVRIPEPPSESAP